MKKITWLFVFIFSVFLCDHCFSASLKNEVIGKPKKGSGWSVKIVKEKDKTFSVFFSEENGKLSFELIKGAGGPVTLIWSPTGNYLMMVGRLDYSTDEPFQKDGLFHNCPLIYDPTRRLIFSNPFPEDNYQFGAAGWVPGSNDDIKVGLYKQTGVGLDGYIENPLGDPDKIKKIAIDYWIKKTIYADTSPYANWFFSKMVYEFSKGKTDYLYKLVKCLKKDELEERVYFLKTKCKIKKSYKFEIINVEFVTPSQYLSPGKFLRSDVNYLSSIYNSDCGSFGAGFHISIQSPDFYPQITFFYLH
uniref:Uncharacterized protein n=1 Tax=candidate division CPR3 bacterium TaxID=2268181 RepID=A0A7C4QX23_UNCC3